MVRFGTELRVQSFSTVPSFCFGTGFVGRVAERDRMFIKVGLGILEIKSAQRSPHVWPPNYRSLYTTKVFDFASYLCSNKHRES